MTDLAAIIEEGERLCRETHAGDGERLLVWSDADGAAALRMLPLLLRLAKAGAEMRGAHEVRAHRRAIVAWDAAARGGRDE